MKREHKEKVTFWGLAVCFLLTGSFLIFSPEWIVRLPAIGKALNSISGELHSLGEALVIAAILAITVDQYLKTRLAKELAHDTFPFLVGYGLPPEAQERIREIVCDSTLIRRDCELNYRIEVLPGDPERVRVELTATLSLDNITLKEQTYKFRTCSACSSQSGRFLRLWCHSQEAGALYDYAPGDLQMEGPDAEENYWINGKEVRIPPKNFERNIKFEVGAKHESFSAYRHDTEEYRFMYPTLRVRVKVEYPEDEFTVCAVPKPSTTYGKFDWEYDRFFVTGEQVAIRWTRKAPVRRKTDPETVNFRRDLPAAVPLSQGKAA